MRASKVLLRWYRSFNTRYHGYDEGNGQSLPWDSYRGQPFPFVEIPLDRHITTIVGANESGKSHLLSAVAKVFTGHGIGDESGFDYAVQDICRYCAFEGLEDNIWPTIGIELTFDTVEEFTAFVGAAGFTVPSAEDTATIVAKKCVVILDGAQSEGQFASVYSVPAMAHLGNVAKSKWNSIAKQQLPDLQFINAKIALSNEVHVRQLIELYDSKSLTPACDPLVLQGSVETIASLSVEANKPIDAALIETITKAKTTLQQSRVGVQSSGQLELQLFRDVLRIPKATLELIAKLGNSDRGFVERLIAEINHRLDETLDLTHFWQQDDQFRLSVDYKSGFFYFEITDKTGAKFTFNERSSGLRYFLSYYIQAKAIERANEKKGSIVLMDEPDSFLSIAGQRNLLQVFESLVSMKAASGTCQLVYTTHSPFLINRNFPKRVVLVRKGDGSEGTQYVPRSAVRRYEPIRSALGVYCAETLFMGATNVVVEGVTDQRILIAAIQRFGDNGDVDRYLNMNTVTFVTAGGAPNVARLVSKSISGDEKRPVAVVLLDGDIAGSNAFQELTAGKILDQEFVATIDQIKVVTPWVQKVAVFEDIIPPSLLATAICRCLKEHWKESVAIATIVAELKEEAGEATTTADRVIASAKVHLGTQGQSIRDEELKGLILDTFAECLLDEQSELAEDALKQFEVNVGIICGKLRHMIDAAERRFQRDSMQKCVRLAVKAVFATPDHCFHFLHIDSCKQWPVADPVQRSLENAHEPILKRAADGLAKLTPEDGDRIMRLVVRRCSLNLLEIQGNRVHVQFWGTNGQADLKPFFKSHKLARPEVEVVLKDRKKEAVTTLTGDSFLYGVLIASDFDLELFQSKWERRFSDEADDWLAAPGTSSGFAWDGLPDGSIPWAAMKSAWRRVGGVVCQNCSEPTILTNFGLRQVGMFNRDGFVENVCGACRRSFRDETVDVKAWFVANLDEGVRPAAEMVWGKRVRLSLHNIDAEASFHAT